MRGNRYFACQRALRVQANGTSRPYLLSLVAAIIALFYAQRIPTVQPGAREPDVVSG